jgi:hypothetical protein
MLLVGTATAFRGDSARILLWSDLFKTTIQFGDDQEATVLYPINLVSFPFFHEFLKVLGALVDNAKHYRVARDCLGVFFSSNRAFRA